MYYRGILCSVDDPPSALFDPTKPTYFHISDTQQKVGYIEIDFSRVPHRPVEPSLFSYIQEAAMAARALTRGGRLRLLTIGLPESLFRLSFRADVWAPSQGATLSIGPLSFTLVVDAHETTFQGAPTPYSKGCRVLQISGTLRQLLEDPLVAPFLAPLG